MTESFEHYEVLPTLDLSVLSPKEMVDLYRFASENEGTVDIGTPWEGRPVGLKERLDNTLSYLPEGDPEIVKEVFTAFADSPHPEDRKVITNCSVYEYAAIDHVAGVALWDRLIRDTDQGVRDAAAAQLDETLSDAVCEARRCSDDPNYDTQGSGMCVIDKVDEAWLYDNAGLTRQDAYNLLESYAYAENGQYLYDLGREALNKLIALTMAT